MSKLEDVRVKKLQLDRKQEEVASLEVAMKKTKECYQDYFFQQNQLFNELQEDFYQSQSSWLYQEMFEQISWQSQGIHDFIEEQQQELKAQMRKLEDQKEELYWQELQSKEKTEVDNER